MFDGKDFSTKNAPLSAQPFKYKKTESDDESEGASTSGASNLRSFEDVEKLPPQSVVSSIKAKIVNLSPKKPGEKFNRKYQLEFQLEKIT